NDVDVGKAAVGDPHFFAVEYPFFAVGREHSLGARVHRVGSGSGFGERVSGNPFAAGKLWQILGFLLGCAEVHNRQRADAHVPTETHGKAAGDSNVLGNDGGRDFVHVRTAVLLRDVHVGDADFARFADQVARDLELLMLDLFQVGDDFISGK